MDRTIGSELERHGGAGPGFDFLRLFLALFIFYGHTKLLTQPGPPLHEIQLGHSGGWDFDWHRPRYAFLVPMFFALSGFLVTGSALRTRNVKTFLTFRILRIFPALATEVTLSALILGAFLTVLPLHEYFADVRFWEYFGNIIGRIRFELPGLFLSNPVPRTVNINLWTLRPEFYCYLFTAVAMGTSIFYNRVLATWVFIAATIALIIANSVLGYMVDPTVYYFVCGCIFFHWRDRLPVGPWWFAGAAVLAFVLLSSTRTVYLAPVFLTYVMACIGLVRFPKIPLLFTGDYSYGVYLYGFPIAQGMIAVWPSFEGHSLTLLAFAGTATMCFAALSWHYIEKPFLKLKKVFIPKKLATA